MKWKNILENVFASVAFAEEGRHSEAMAIAGVKASRRTFRQVVEDLGAAVAFAEEREFGYAYALATDTVQAANKKSELIAFLETIGLKEAPIRYGIAHI